ncbi:hypothetical protein C2S51_019183 [Perilla frutescens var. frutescens]|nr:hypothetical protein C2S51_019183 [Perilla frutescens var. frutescens]
MEPEVVIASSPTDAGISCWDLHTGAEHLRYKSCASPPHGLASVAGHFLAFSQVRDAKSSTSGSILYWSWNKPQIEVRSFPAEAIRPIACNSQGTYITGGGISGDIYFWEGQRMDVFVFGHCSCRIFDTARREEARNLFEYSFHEHSLRVTDVKTGYGGCNAIIVSASEDRTCKVWSLSRGKLLRNIVFPSIIDVISIDPGEHVLYAGGRDGKIYIAALNAPVAHNNNYGPHIIGSLSEHRKSVTCLASSADGFLLVSGSEDGMIRVWDTRTRNIIRVSRHSKVNNVIITRHPQLLNPQTSASDASLRRHALALPPPLEKFANSSDENAMLKPYPYVIARLAISYCSKQQGSTAAAEVDVGRPKNEQLRSLQMIQHWETMYENLHQFCVDEILEENRPNNQNV